jgi:hypothetical protein
MARGSPKALSLLSAYPLLGLVAFDLRALVSRTEHPGILELV